MSKRICIIPARGGSKRIPRKNIRNFLGKPIIAYSIETAINSGYFDEVMVSTDDAEIAEIAQQYGANVPFVRSADNANDHATTVDVLLEVIHNYQQLGQSFETGCCLYPCAPLVKSSYLKRAFERLSEGYESVIPVTKFGFPIQRAFRVLEKDQLAYFYPEHEKTRSQDLEQAYHDVGQFYCFEINTLMTKKTLVPTHTGYIELLGHQAQDIDNEEDWKLAELKYQIDKK